MMLVDIMGAVENVVTAVPAPIVTTMATPIAGVPDARTGSTLTCTAPPQAACDAFGHYAEDLQAERPEPTSPADEATKQLDTFDAMLPADTAKALGAMTPEQVTQLAQDLPEEERARLVELAKLSPNPDAKLALFLAGQKAKLRSDVNADLDGQMDAETAAKMESRRVRIGISTALEMQREAELLRAKGQSLTADEVNEMIARKTREHDLEMKYNVNLTADEHERTVGPLAGKRVVWTDDELKVMEAALAQAPVMKNGTNTELTEFHRSEDIGANADHDPSTGTIRIADAALRNEKTDVIDPSGKPGASDMRERAADPAIEDEYGLDTTLMEWVVLHELGHNVHDLHETEAYETYKQQLRIEELDPTQLQQRLPADLAQHLDHGLKEVEFNGIVYVKDGDGYKCFPRAVYDEPDANHNMPNPESGEYFAQHYNQAILAPESTAVEYLDKPQELEKQATDQLEKARQARATVAASGQDTKDSDRLIEKLEQAQRHAIAQREVWAETYKTMRDDVFHADAAEQEARDRLAEAGIDTTEFDERAARLSTPDQIARLEEEIASTAAT
jgi:hypothetical protein